MEILRLWRRSRFLALLTTGLLLAVAVVAAAVATQSVHPTTVQSVLYGIAVGMVLGITLAASLLTRDSGRAHGAEES